MRNVIIQIFRLLSVVFWGWFLVCVGFFVVVWWVFFFFGGGVPVARESQWIRISVRCFHVSILKAQVVHVGKGGDHAAPLPPPPPTL